MEVFQELEVTLERLPDNAEIQKGRHRLFCMHTLTSQLAMHRGQVQQSQCFYSLLMLGAMTARDMERAASVGKIHYGNGHGHLHHPLQHIPAML